MISSVVIAFGHRARSGKDTAANEIIKQRGLLDPMATTLGGPQERYDIRKYGFADCLKREVTALARKAGGMEKLFAPEYCFPKKGYVVTLPEWVTYDPNRDMSDPLCPLGKQRKLLQWYGSDYRRADDDTYWIRQLERTIELEKPQIAILSDMRFPNEMACTSPVWRSCSRGSCRASAKHTSKRDSLGRFYGLVFDSRELRDVRGFPCGCSYRLR